MWLAGIEGCAAQLGKVTKTPAICSCVGCGNPRKWFKEKTKHELSFEEISSIDIDEIYEAP